MRRGTWFLRSAALASDFRLAFRALARTPGFTAIAVLILGIGIGLNTAVFSVINAVALRPFFGESRPGQLAAVYAFDRTRPGAYRDFSYPLYVDIRDRNAVFSQTAGLGVSMVGLGEGEMTRRGFAFIATSTLFPLFDARPTRGRAFLPEEETPGAERLVTIVSEEYWHQMGADPDIVGKTIRINTRLFTVIGIAPGGFGGPTTLFTPAVWLPTGVYDTIAGGSFGQTSRGRFADRAEQSMTLYARMKPGVPYASARTPLATLAGQLEQAFPAEHRNLGLEVRAISRTGIGTSPQNDAPGVRSAGAGPGHDPHRPRHRLHEPREHAACAIDEPAARDRRSLRPRRQPNRRHPAVAHGRTRAVPGRQCRRPARHLLDDPGVQRVVRAGSRDGADARHPPRPPHPGRDARVRGAGHADLLPGPRRPVAADRRLRRTQGRGAGRHDRPASVSEPPPRARRRAGCAVAGAPDGRRVVRARCEPGCTGRARLLTRSQRDRRRRSEPDAARRAEGPGLLPPGARARSRHAGNRSRKPGVGRAVRQPERDPAGAHRRAGRRGRADRQRRRRQQRVVRRGRRWRRRRQERGRVGLLRRGPGLLPGAAHSRAARAGLLGGGGVRALRGTRRGHRRAALPAIVQGGRSRRPVHLPAGSRRSQTCPDGGRGRGGRHASCPVRDHAGTAPVRTVRSALPADDDLPRPGGVLRPRG